MVVDIDLLCKDLSLLDEHLSDKSYVQGYIFSSDDTLLFKKIPQTHLTTYPQINRWYNHIKSLLSSTQQVRS